MMKLASMENVTRENLICKLTEKEILVFAKRSAQASKELADLEVQKKQITDDIKAKMSLHEAEVQICGSRVRDGYEYRMIECHWILDPIPKGSKLPDSKSLIRDDTGELVRQVRLTAEELKELSQGKLELVPEKKDDKKGGPSAN
jgi:hypothetical protein